MNSSAAVPRVSVLLTSYNYGRFITQALDSIFAQRGVDFEIVLVDNGSTDDTLERIEPYRADPRLRVFLNETNLGVTGNHNKAFEHSRGEYVVWLSADDRFLPGHLSRALAWYAEHPEIDVFYTDALVAFTDGAAFGPRSHPGHPPFAYTGGRPEFGDLLTRGCYMCWPTMVFKRSLIEAFGPMNPAFTGSDYEYVIRLAAAGKTFAFRPTPAAIVRFHDAQLTGAAWHARGENITELLRIIDAHLTPQSAPYLRGRRGVVGAWLSAALADAPGVSDSLRERAQTVVLRSTDESVERVTVVVFSEGRIGLLRRSLESIAAQTHTNLDVIVVSQFGYDITGYVELVLGHQRFQIFSDPTGDVVTHRRRALEIAGGDAIAYLREGDTYRADHIERGVAQLRAGYSVSIATANGVTETAFSNSFTPTADSRIDEGLYNDGSRPLGIADDVPIDALIHRRECWDQTDFLRPSAGPVAEWEYVLRLVFAGGVSWTGQRTVDILAIRQIIVHAHDDLKTWYTRLIGQFHDALPVTDAQRQLREQLIERLDSRFAQDTPDARDFEAIESWRRELTGAELYRVSASGVRRA